ncbi:MAG: DUF4270 family protein [Bacteroidota bacterium]
MSRSLYQALKTLPLSILIFPLIFSCNKLETTTIGNDLIPGSDKLITDTLYLNIETRQSNLDSANLDTTSIQRNEGICIGAVDDELFGKTTASAYFQVLPASLPFSFPVSKDSITLDSIVLAITYAGTYGDTNALSKVEVFRVADPGFLPNKKYRINESPAFSFAGKLGEASFTPSQLKLGYKLQYKNDTTFNQLRIRLNNQLGTELLNENNITGAFKNDTTFRDFLNGFAVVPDSTLSGKGALHYYSLNVTTSNLQLFYRYKKRTGGDDTTVAFFPFETFSAKTALANKIHRTIPASLSSDVDHIHIMTAPGISAYLNIKGLDTLKGKPYVVHRAEIIAEEADGANVSTILTPPVTHLFSINNSGRQSTIPYDSSFYFNRVSFDFNRNLFLNSITQSYCGGLPGAVTVNNRKLTVYRYNVTRYVQNVINGNTQTRVLKIAAPYFAEFAGDNISIAPLNAVAAGRVKLKGGSHPTKPMRLIIYYSKP